MVPWAKNNPGGYQSRGSASRQLFAWEAMHARQDKRRLVGQQRCEMLEEAGLAQVIGLRGPARCALTTPARRRSPLLLQT